MRVYDDTKDAFVWGALVKGDNMDAFIAEPSTSSTKPHEVCGNCPRKVVVEIELDATRCEGTCIVGTGQSWKFVTTSGGSSTIDIDGEYELELDGAAAGGAQREVTTDDDFFQVNRIECNYTGTFTAEGTGKFWMIRHHYTNEDDCTGVIDVASSKTFTLKFAFYSTSEWSADGNFGTGAPAPFNITWNIAGIETGFDILGATASPVLDNEIETGASGCTSSTAPFGGGSGYGVTVVDINREAARIRIYPLPQPKGLGTTVAAIANWLGIPQCWRCKLREWKLNRWFPYDRAVWARRLRLA